MAICCFECQFYPGRGEPCQKNKSLNGCGGSMGEGKECKYYEWVACRCVFFVEKGEAHV
jgi:hypothetical protein